MVLYSATPVPNFLINGVFNDYCRIPKVARHQAGVGKLTSPDSGPCTWGSCFLVNRMDAVMRFQVSGRKACAYAPNSGSAFSDCRQESLTNSTILMTDFSAEVRNDGDICRGVILSGEMLLDCWDL